MWIRKIQKKKKQYALIAMILLFLTAVLAGCASFVIGVGGIVEDHFDKSTDAYAVIYNGESQRKLERAVKIMTRYLYRKNMILELFRLLLRKRARA